MLELDHLTVAGDVSFGRGVILRGTVIIVANEGNKIELPDGTILENKLVSGEFDALMYPFIPLLISGQTTTTGNLQLTDH
jgi:hypothetical protein